MINDLLIYTHLPSTLPPGVQDNPDFQIVQDPMTVVNRTSTAALAVNTVFDLVRCTVLTGGAGGSGNLNQNEAGDAALWLPILASSEAIPEFTTLSAYQRVTFSYENVDSSPEPRTFGPIQTAFIGHRLRAGTPPDIELLRPYIYYTPAIEIPGGGFGVQYIHVQPSYDLMVHQFYARALPLSIQVTVRDVASGYNFTNEPVYAENIAYTNMGERSNFRQPFLPWVAPKDHRYRIEFYNSGQTQTVQFAFAGRLCIVH